MPIYVYRNLTTGTTFEVEQRMVDAALTTDPSTGDPVKRLIQPVGIAFKGSGFYVTDSRGAKGAKGASSVAAAGPNGSNGAAKAESGAADAGTTGAAGSAEKSARADSTPAAPLSTAKVSGSTGAAASD